MKYGININTQVETTLLWDLFSIYDTVNNYFTSLLLRKLGIVEQTKLNMHTTHASTQCSVRQQSVHTNWVWLYRFVENKNTLEKYFYTSITSVTIYLCHSSLVISFKWVFKKKNTVFLEAKFFFAKKRVFKKKFLNCITRDDRSLWDPRPYLAGRRVVLLVEARRHPGAEVHLKPYNQIVLVDHLNKKAVRCQTPLKLTLLLQLFC